MRYIVEFMSQRPTLGEGDYKWGTTVDAPIFNRLKQDIYINKKPIAFKRHKLSDENINDKKILLLIRDYKEILARKSYVNFKLNKSQKETIEDYIEIIYKFHKCDNDKLLIYYEDLVTNIGDCLNQIMVFFNVNNKDRTKEFIHNIDMHRKQCIGVYNKIDKSHSNGSFIHFHSDKIPLETLKNIDNFVFKNYKYVKQYLDRYRR